MFMLHLVIFVANKVFLLCRLANGSAAAAEGSGDDEKISKADTAVEVKKESESGDKASPEKKRHYRSRHRSDSSDRGGRRRRYVQKSQKANAVFSFTPVRSHELVHCELFELRFTHS